MYDQSATESQYFLDIFDKLCKITDGYLWFCVDCKYFLTTE